MPSILMVVLLLVVPNYCVSWLSPAFPTRTPTTAQRGSTMPSITTSMNIRGEWTKPYAHRCMALPTSSFCEASHTARQNQQRQPRSLLIRAAEEGSIADDEPELDEDSDQEGLVFAKLDKPVGLMLAESEMEQPGLKVDELIEGGSAEQCGVVKLGMSLVSACGVDCTELTFDEVAALLQDSPADIPIDFVFRDDAQP